jgi:hypothetical protein
MKTKFNNPRIMILLGSLDAPESLNSHSFEELVNNEKKNLRKIVEKIMKYMPDLLLVEKQVNRIATEFL